MTNQSDTVFNSSNELAVAAVNCTSQALINSSNIVDPIKFESLVSDAVKNVLASLHGETTPIGQSTNALIQELETLVKEEDDLRKRKKEIEQQEDQLYQRRLEIFRQLGCQNIQALSPTEQTLPFEMSLSESETQSQDIHNDSSRTTIVHTYSTNQPTVITPAVVNQEIVTQTEGRPKRQTIPNYRVLIKRRTARRRGIDPEYDCRFCGNRFARRETGIRHEQNHCSAPGSPNHSCEKSHCDSSCIGTKEWFPPPKKRPGRKRVLFLTNQQV